MAASTLPYRSHPDTGDPAWIPTAHLLSAHRWRDLGESYSHSRGLPGRAPGLVCALQHYSGRALQVMVVAWCADGSLLDPDHSRWWARIDTTGATTAVSVPGLPVAGRDDDPQAFAAVVHRHVDPLIDAVAEAGGASRGLAVGCTAASCAGAFAVAFRGVATTRRDEIELSAREVLRTFDATRSRASVVRLRDPDALTHDRHTCCLIHLGREGRRCGSCPRVPHGERRQRQRAGALAPRVHVDLTSAR